MYKGSKERHKITLTKALEVFRKISTTSYTIFFLRRTSRNVEKIPVHSF